MRQVVIGARVIEVGGIEVGGIAAFRREGCRRGSVKPHPRPSGPSVRGEPDDWLRPLALGYPLPEDSAHQAEKGRGRGMRI